MNKMNHKLRVNHSPKGLAHITICHPGSCVLDPASSVLCPMHTQPHLPVASHPGSFDWSVITTYYYKSLSALVINCDKHVLSERDRDLVTFNQSQVILGPIVQERFHACPITNPG